MVFHVRDKEADTLVRDLARLKGIGLALLARPGGLILSIGGEA